MDISFKLILACSIFLAVYAFIMLEKLDRTLVAFIGASLMILTRVLSQEHAFGHIDFNTIGLLISMMIIVMIVKRTGLFQYLAIKVVKIAKGEPIKLLMLLAIITGVLSSILDNVTTILLILPITFDIVKDLHISPIPFIMAEVFASNVGGTATLIGDPPNIMIGSSVGLTFTDFIKYDTPVIIPLLLLTTFIFSLIYKRKLATKEEARKKVLQMDEKAAIKDKKLLVKSLVVLGFTFMGFILHGMLHYESATIAIVGAVVLLTISKLKPEKILLEVEWSTIIFFCGLFILVGGLQESGAIKLLAEWVLSITHGNLLLTTMAVLWVSAIASAFIDNIPFVATMIPMIKDMGQLSGMDLAPLWWALSLGACLGGNGTIIGASANVIAVGMAKERGHKITFKNYFKLAFPMTILTVIISTVYLYLVFFL